MKNFRMIAILLIIVMMSLALFGCGKKAPAEKKEPGPKEAVEAFFKAVKEKDSESIEKLYEDDFVMGDFTEAFTGVGEAESMGFPDEFIDGLESKMLEFDYKIKGEKTDGDKAVVSVDMTTYDFGACVETWWAGFYNWAIENGDAFDDEDYTAKAIDDFAKAIDDAEKDYKESVDIAVSKKDGKWVVDSLNDNEKFVNAFTGGIIPALDDLEEQMQVGEE